MDVIDNSKFFNELGFFTLCNAAPSLGKFLKDTITISSAKTEVFQASKLDAMFLDSVFATIVFNKKDVGETHVIISKEEAITLANYVIQKRLPDGEYVNELNEFAINAIEEIVNILGGNMTEILTVIYGKGVEIDVPELREAHVISELYEKNESLILNTFTMHLGKQGKVKLKELAKQSYYMELINQLKSRV